MTIHAMYHYFLKFHGIIQNLMHMDSQLTNNLLSSLHFSNNRCNLIRSTSKIENLTL